VTYMGQKDSIRGKWGARGCVRDKSHKYRALLGFVSHKYGIKRTMH
jgi:hypothetical protein